MIFFNWKKPKHRHKNPEIRLAAIPGIPSSDTDTLSELAATDTDQRVRLAALARIDNPEALAVIISRASDPSIAEEAARKRARIVTDQLLPLPASEALPLLTSLADVAILYDVAVLAKDTKTRLAAVAGIADEVTLTRIAMAPCGKEVALAALDRVTNKDLLAAIARDASNKHARSAAQGKVGPQPTPSRESQEPDDPTPLLAEILAKALRVRDSSSWDLARERFAELLAAWDKQDAGHDHPLWRDFVAAREHFEKRAASYLEKEQRAQEAAERYQRDFAACAALCREIEELASSGSPPLETDLSTLGERFEILAAALRETDALPFRKKVRAALTRCEQARDARRQEQARLSALLEECRNIEMLINKDLPKAAISLESLEERAKAERFSYLSSAPLRDWLEKLRPRLTEKQERETARRETSILEALTTRRDLCLKLETALSLADDTAFDREARETEREWKKLSPPTDDRFNETDRHYQHLLLECAVRRRDVENRNEWQRWANRTRKEELCAVVESLREQTDLGLVFRNVMEAQREWKTIGPVPRDEAEPLWQRFHAACEEQFTRAKPFLEEQDRERAANLEKKRELATRVEGLGEPENWQAAADTVKALQAEFNGIGPVPRDEEADITTRFRSACNAFFERRRHVLAELDEQRAANLAEKQKICDEAEVLTRTPEAANAPRLRELQKRWKDAGPGPREEEQKVWERFRGLCDAFFSTLDSMREDNLRKKQTLCEEAEALLARAADDEDLDGIAERLKALQQEWKAIGSVPDQFRELLWERFRAACDSFFARRKEIFEEQEKIRSENLSRKQELLREAEECGQGVDREAATAALKALQTKWQEIGPVPREAREIEQRFRQLCNAFFQEKRRIFEEQTAARFDNQKRKESICFQLERLLGLTPSSAAGESSPAKALTLAEELKLALETNFALAGRATDKQSVKDEVRRLQNEWKTLGSAPREIERSLRERFHRALDTFYHSEPPRGREAVKSE